MINFTLAHDSMCISNIHLADYLVDPELILSAFEPPAALRVDEPKSRIRKLLEQPSGGPRGIAAPGWRNAHLPRSDRGCRQPGAGDPVAAAARKRAGFAASICQKWMLTCAACASATLRTGDPPQAWHTARATLDLSPLADAPQWRPVKLALHRPRSEVVIDVTDVSLIVTGGRELLANGDFSHGFDSWWTSAEVKSSY